MDNENTPTEDEMKAALEMEPDAPTIKLPMAILVRNAKEFFNELMSDKKENDAIYDDMNQLTPIGVWRYQKANQKAVLEFAQKCSKCEQWGLIDDMADHDTPDNKEGTFDDMCPKCVASVQEEIREETPKDVPQANANNHTNDLSEEE